VLWSCISEFSEDLPSVLMGIGYSTADGGKWTWDTGIIDASFPEPEAGLDGMHFALAAYPDGDFLVPHGGRQSHSSCCITPNE